MKVKLNLKPTIGFIGAGNMGLPMIKNLINKGFQVSVYDINPKITKKIEKDKAVFEITRLISSRIEEWILDKPEQWLWAHRRWGKQNQN